MRIGILGGTFDPPHNGHLALAKAAKADLNLDEVWFIPAGRNPLKGRNDQTPARARLEMVKLAVADEPGFAVSDIEIVRGGASFMAETLFELTAALQGEFWLIMGADSLASFNQWRSPDKILRMARLAVAVRESHKVDVLKAKLSPEVIAKVDWLSMPAVDISSTGVRDTISLGRSAQPWVPRKVLQYIEQNKLYR